MLRKPIYLLALALLCCIAPVTLRADEPEKTGEKQDSPLPARADRPQPPAAEAIKTGKKRDTLLYVHTDPPGATVFLNGKELGTTNGLFPVEPGNGTILLELDGHQAGQRPVILRANGITRVELNLAPKAEAGAAKSEPKAVPPAAKRVKFSSTSLKFANGDDIKIEEVRSERGTLAEGDTVTVKGTYTLSSHPAATLLFSITTQDVSRDKATLSQQVQAGTAIPFEMTRPITCDGRLHIGFYPVQGGGCFGTVYFGVKAQTGEKEQAPPATFATAKKMKFFLGPKAFQKGDKIEIQEVWSERGTLL
jgi:hypothetical protein